MEDKMDKICLTCGCEIRSNGHDGTMCRTIAALKSDVTYWILEHNRVKAEYEDALSAIDNWHKVGTSFPRLNYLDGPLKAWKDACERLRAIALRNDQNDS